MFWENLWIGVVSGVVASIVFFTVLLFIKPRIKVSKQIAVTDAEQSICQIKVVNNNIFKLKNVKYVLTYEEHKIGGNVDIQTILPMKEPVIFLYGKDRKDKNQRFALKISYSIPPEKRLTKNTRLSFAIFGEHSLSNTISCKQVFYTEKDFIVGHFETGKSMKII